MDKLILPYTFTGGQSAKAQEVNVNFKEVVKYIENLITTIENLQTQINDLQREKADQNGDKTKVFNVAPALEDNHAVPFYQMKEIMSTFSDVISGLIPTKTGNKQITISKGGCLDSTREHQIKLIDNYTLDVTNVTLPNYTFDIFIISELDNPTNTYCEAAQNIYGLALGENQTYRQIGTFTTDENENIKSVERVEF